jgi:predicted DNA-binding transcriptional regulator AlpA
VKDCKTKKRRLALQSKPTRMIRIEEVARHAGLSVSSIYKLIRCEQFPSGVKLTSRARAWTLESVDAWLDAKIAEGES